MLKDSITLKYQKNKPKYPKTQRCKIHKQNPNIHRAKDPTSQRREIQRPKDPKTQDPTRQQPEDT